MEKASCNEIVVKTFNTEKEMQEWLTDEDKVDSFRTEMREKHGPHSASLDLIDKKVNITLK